MWEVYVGVTKRVALGKKVSDQWVQRADRVVLESQRLRMKVCRTMECGAEIQLEWDSMCDAIPYQVKGDDGEGVAALGRYDQGGAAT